MSKLQTFRVTFEDILTYEIDIKARSAADAGAKAYKKFIDEGPDDFNFRDSTSTNWLAEDEAGAQYEIPDEVLWTS